MHVLTKYHCLGVAALVFACVDANAQQLQSAAGYPQKPIRILVTGAAGGSGDNIARTVGDKLAEQWNNSVVVDNRMGAGGALAMDLAARAAPDGYTLWNLSSSSLANAAVAGSNKLAVDIRRSFAPVSQLISQPYIFVITPSLPVASIKELIAYSKKNPGTLNYASFGLGSTTHLGMELFKSMTGTSITHVPFKGSALASVDLFAGQVHILLGGSLFALPHVKAGRLKALAVTTAKRSAMLPDLVTVSEAGVPGYDVNAWFGFVVVSKTPPAIVSKIHREVARILVIPNIKDRLASYGSEASVSASPEEFGQLIKSDFDRWEKFAKSSGISFE